MTHDPRTNPLPLAGKIALVTGGTTGIGRTTAELFHAAGAQVIVTGVDADRLERARQELPPGTLVLRSDARSLEDCERLAQEIRAKHGGLDVAFLNAGVAALAPFAATDERLYTEQFDANAKGVFFTLNKLLPVLRPGASVIVNTSVAALKGSPHMAAYAASKGAVSALVRTLAVELASQQVRVNAVAPAMIHTPIQGKFGLPAEVQATVERDTSARIPLGRFGEAHEVAQVVLFLAGDGASFVTGVEVPVDGGFMAT